MRPSPFARIRRACSADLPGVFSLEMSYSELDLGDRTSLGFLVSGFTIAEYRDLLQDPGSVFLVSEHPDTGEVVGFLVAVQSGSPWVTREVARWTQTQGYKEFMLVKQICIDRMFSGHGIGAALYSQFFAEIAGLPVFAAIVTEPRNIRSLRFHESVGFSRSTEYRAEDGLVRELWGIRPSA